jgi:medium-chain acyl-[acyl-carrier-protein] hydrolase
MLNKTEQSKWLIQLNTRNDERVRLIVFPYAGGSAGAFRPWRDRLPGWISVQLIQLPGRENRFNEPPISKWDEITNSIADAGMLLDGPPVVLFGHSMGSILAFEVARELRRRHDRSPAALIVSGRCAPQLDSRMPPLAHLDGRDLVNRLTELYGGIPTEALADPELVELMAHLLKADLQVVEDYRYVPQPPLACPIAAYGGTRDPLVTSVELCAWSEQTRSGFRSELYPGDHFYFRAAESENRLLAEVRRICATASGLATNG